MSDPMHEMMGVDNQPFWNWRRQVILFVELKWGPVCEYRNVSNHMHEMMGVDIREGSPRSRMSRNSPWIRQILLLFLELKKTVCVICGVEVGACV
jgi:hypothetical protein